MQISRSLLVACAAACATTLAVRGNDTPAQIKAREAMQQKLQEAPAAAPQKSQAVPAQPAPAASVPVASDTPVPPPALTVAQADPDSIAKAREAVRQRIVENPSTPPTAAAVAPVAAPAAPPVAVPPPVVVVPPLAESTSVSASTSDSDSISKAREAVRQKIGEDSEVGPKADSESLAKAREAVRQRIQLMTYSDPNSGIHDFQPLEGPPLAISSDKQQHLYELLQRYKADQVSPEQYHAERAKILAGP